jgi:hypothetical protein
VCHYADVAVHLARLLLMTNDCVHPSLCRVHRLNLLVFIFSVHLLSRRASPVFVYYCWVYVPHPFSLAKLSLRLLRVFFSNYISQGKERAMIGILEGNRDPIQECRLLLQHHTRWLLILDAYGPRMIGTP